MKKIIEYFTTFGEKEALEGGQNLSFRSGNLVFKPEEFTEKYIWMAEQLESIHFQGIIVPSPIRSKRGNFLEENYGAAPYVPCSFQEGRMAEKIEAAQLFHEATSHIQPPRTFKNWSSHWSKANELAWGELDPPRGFPKLALDVIQLLRSQMDKVDLPVCFIHGDLGGNTLFQGDTPVIIDISPEFRPQEYGLALLVTDSIAWHKEPLQSLDLLPMSEELKRQMVLRVVLFRACVSLFRDQSAIESFTEEYRVFSPALEYLGLNPPII